MQTKHKASPAFDTLSLGALAAELAKYQQEPPQMASGSRRQTWLFAATFCRSCIQKHPP